MATRAPDEVLAAIPGWEGAAWRKLSGGLTNKPIHVEKDGLLGVLKIDAQERSAPFNTRQAEARVQTMAATAGLAARVLYSDSCVYLTEYVAGIVWERPCLAREDNLDLLAATLKRLHSLPLSGRSFDAGVAAQRYGEQIDNPDQRIVALCGTVIENLRLPQNLCCCHNDLVATNMISAPALMFLDWEYACDNDPFFDLATVVEHHELSAEQTMYFLNAYCSGDGRRWRQHLAGQQKLYLALLWLWMAHRPDADPVELERVATRLATSCS